GGSLVAKVAEQRKALTEVRGRVEMVASVQRGLPQAGCQFGEDVGPAKIADRRPALLVERRGPGEVALSAGRAAQVVEGDGDAPLVSDRLTSGKVGRECLGGRVVVSLAQRHL